MTLRLSQVALDLDEDESRLRHKVAEHLGIAAKEISDLRIVRRGIDARRKPRLFRIFSVDFEVADQVALLHRHRDNKNLREAPGFSAPEIVPITGGHRVLVVGMGPAGLFAALRLAQSGADVALVERGRELERRCADVQNLWQEGVLDAESDPQFGEGGAGTFSDGKLTTRISMTPGFPRSCAFWWNAAPPKISWWKPNPMWGPTVCAGFCAIFGSVSSPWVWISVLKPA